MSTTHARIGAVLVPTMPIYRDDEVGYVLAQRRAKVAVVAEEFQGFDYLDMLARIRPQEPELAHVVAVRSSERDTVIRLQTLCAGEPPSPAELGVLRQAAAHLREMPVDTSTWRAETVGRHVEDVRAMYLETLAHWPTAGKAQR